MSFKLIEGQPAFQVTREGPFEYHTFEPGKIYTSIPSEEADRFEEIQTEEGGN